MMISDALCDSLPFVQFKKHEKHQWRSVSFQPAWKSVSFQPATLLKLALLNLVFFTIFKLYKSVPNRAMRLIPT